MPSEQLPWDRKEVFLKEQRQDRVVGSDAVRGGDVTGGGACSTSRWRETYHGLRDCSRASPRRPLTGHYRYDGGYHQHHPEESGGHGCTPSRSDDRFCPEEEILRPSGRSGVSSRITSSGGRESRGSSRRSPCLDSSGDCSRQRHFSPVTAQRSVVVPVTYTSSSSSSPILLKNVVDKSDGGIIDGSGTGQIYDRDHSLGSISWKPLKWNRPTSLSLSKTVRAEAEEACLEISVPPVKETPATSPVKSHLPSDDRGTSKKPRLGWGQGLAKYEKQKVEGSVDVSGQNVSVQSTNSGKDFVRDSSPKFSALPGSVSPASPTSASATCSSSPACAEEKLSKVLNAETERSQCNNSSALRFQNSPENISINFDGLDSNSISTLDLLLADLMQPEEFCSGDSSLTRHSTLNKLLLLKNDISKELERTECEIDLFENKLKSINCDMQRNNYQDNSILSPSVGPQEEHAVPIHLLEDHSIEAKDTNYCSTGTILCDVQLAFSETKNINSSTLQTDMCPLINTDDKSPFPDEELPVSSPSDFFNDELSLDHIYKNADGNSVALILAYNKHAAESANQEFDHAMPTGISQFNLWESDNILQCSKNYMHIRGKIAMNKRLLKFKERVLALKFRALHHLWREDLNLLTMKKNRPKSNKRSEVNSRLPQLALQKNRSSTRSRYALSAGNLTLVPTTEILNFTSKLLSDSQVKLYRNNLKMPAQIIDERDKKYSRYTSYNGLIEDPSALEKERKMMNPWTPEEMQLFLEMLATFGKDFKKISSCIPPKTTADCVEFYYKNHKSGSFTEVTRQLKLRKQWQSSHSNTYLLTSGTRLNREANATSLELLGSASIMAAESNCMKRSNQKTSGCKVSRRINGFHEKAGSEISGSEKEVAAVDVLAGICCALSSDAMSSCVTSSIDFSEKMHFAAIDRSLTPEAANQTIEEEDGCSNESSDGMESADSADWNDDEKTMFIRAFNMYGKDFVKIAHFVRTRSRDQCKIFFSKARKCLGLDVIQPGSTNGVTPTSDANEGRSGTDDACSTQSCSKMDADFTQSMLETCSEGRVHASNTSLLTDPDKSCAQCDIEGSVPDDVEGKLDNSSSVLKEEDKKPFACAETDNENARDMLSPKKFTFELNSEDKLKSQITFEAPRKDRKVDPNQSVVLLDLPVENRARANMEENGAVGDPYILGQCSQSNGERYNAVQQKISGCSNHILSTNFQHQAPMELRWSLPNGAQTKKVDMSEPAVSCRSNNVLPDFSSASFNEADVEISVQSLQDGGKFEQKPVIGDPFQNPLETTFPNPIDSFSPMASRGSQTLNHKKLKVDRKLIDEKSPTRISSVENRTSDSKCYIASESICAGSDVLNFSPEHIRERHFSTEKSGFLEPEGQSHRVGDLKLFGQILSHPSTHKLSSLPEGAKANVTSNSSAASKDKAIFVPMARSKTRTHFLGELPQRSYDFWESNEIQTGLSCYQVSSAGMPFLTGFDSDYPQQAQVLSEKKFLDPFPSEQQKRNGFDVISGFQQPQQQRRMVQLGVSMVGAEPVAALQMHYSGGRAKILTGDLETLTGETRGR